MSSIVSRWLPAAAAALAIGASPAHALDCGTVTAALAGRVQDLRCVDSPDLTTQNPDTTPLDNSRADLPPLAFTPRTDRGSVVSDVQRTPLTRAVPGLQITGAMADNDGARFVIRLPAAGFTGRLIVGVPGALRSEYTGDFFASDLVVQRGDAYVMSNKGAYNLRLTAASDPLGCPLAPPGVPAAQIFVRASAGVATALCDRAAGESRGQQRAVDNSEPWTTAVDRRSTPPRVLPAVLARRGHAIAAPALQSPPGTRRTHAKHLETARAGRRGDDGTDDSGRGGLPG